MYHNPVVRKPQRERVSHYNDYFTDPMRGNKQFPTNMKEEPKPEHLNKRNGIVLELMLFEDLYR